MDPHTGKTWSGRGRRPGWLRGNESRYQVTGF
ncbi:H-NS family nucleoid-associated regulatory protein [Cupriavidus sp. CuC1]